MIYTRIEFTLLFVTVFFLYLIVRSPMIRMQILLLSSFFFYAWAGAFDLGIFLVVIGLSYLSVVLATKYPRYKSWFLGLGIAIMAIHLLGWKYLPWAARGAGKELNIPLPLGISFFTLQGIGYLVDVGRNQIPLMKFREYALFKAFFPQLIAGPIVRGSELWDFLKTMPNPRRLMVIEGLFLIGTGFIKKLIIADYLSIFVDGIFTNPGSLDRATLMLGAVAFYIQIWGDFSGYTDIGRGTALMFGVRLPENFYSTLYARGGTDWSRRWHASLQTWVRDYLYFPLANFFSRFQFKFWSEKTHTTVSSVISRYISAMMVALWHGAAMNFFVWGLVLWFMATLESILHMMGLTPKNPTFPRKVFNFLAMLPMFFLIGVFFRCPDMNILGDYLKGLFGPNTNSVSFVEYAHPAYWRIALAFGIDGIMYYSLRTKRFVILEFLKEKAQPFYQRNPLLSDVLLGVAAAALIVGALMYRANNNVAGFIYFRF